MSKKVAIVVALLISRFPAGAQRPPAGSGPAPQASAALFSVSGVVLDPSEASVTGAKVMLQGKARDHQWSGTTDAAGSFRFDGVSPGSYDVQVQGEGFKLSRTHLRVGPRAPAPLRIVLPIADLYEQVTIGIAEGRVSTEIAENLDVDKLNPRLLESLPILGQDVIGAVAKLLDPASVGSSGVTVVVDGMPSTEKGLPASAIQEVKINNNPYSAEYARPGKGRIEIIRKPGSSSYHGSFYFNFRDYRLDARNAFAVERPPEQHRQFDASFSGPLGKSKKTTFLISASRSEDERQSVVYALGLPGPIRENVAQPQRSTYFSSQLAFAAGKNSLLFRYSLFDWSDRGEGVGGFNLPEVASDSISRYHQLYSAYKAVITPRLLNDLLVRLRREDGSTLSRQLAVPQIVVLDAFTGGGGGVQQHGNESRVELTDVLSWSHGRHFVKTGVNVPDLSRSGSEDLTNFNGTFYFPSLDDRVRGRPFSFVRQQGPGRLIFWQKQVGLFVQDDIRIHPNFSMGFGLRYDWQKYVLDHNNVAPRLSFAFAPDKARKTVLRGGVGLFYDAAGLGAISDVLRYNGRGLREVVLSNPGYPDPFSFGGLLSSLPGTLVRFAPDLRAPYRLQYSFGVERQLQKSLAFTATYIGTRGVKLFRSRDLNAPPPPLYLLRPDPSVGVFRQIESSGRLESHTLDVALRGNLTRFFNGMVMYAQGRAYDNTDGIKSFPADNYDLSGEWARSRFDRRHFFYVYGTLSAGKWLNLGLIFSASSGTPYSLTTGRDDNRDGFAKDRPSGVPRNSLEGPGSATLDLRWSRSFPLHSKSKDKGPSATLGLDAFNALNRVNLGPPVGNLNSPFFGRSVAAGPARRWQASVGLSF